MSQGQLTKIFDSGSESKDNDDLRVQDVISTSCKSNLQDALLATYGIRGIVIPMRFRLVEQDPTFTKVSDDLAVFRDVLYLPRPYGTLVKKVLNNLNCRLDRTTPRRPRWGFSWRKRKELDLGARFFITYRLKGSPYNTIELNEANWSDLHEMFWYSKPKEAVFRVDWWMKGESTVESVRSAKEDDVVSCEDSVEFSKDAFY